MKFNCVLYFLSGGSFSDIGSNEVTHLVVDNQNVKDVPNDLNLPPFVVRGEVSFSAVDIYIRDVNLLSLGKSVNCTRAMYYFDCPKFLATKKCVIIPKF